MNAATRRTFKEVAPIFLVVVGAAAVPLIAAMAAAILWIESGAVWAGPTTLAAVAAVGVGAWTLARRRRPDADPPQTVRVFVPKGSTNGRDGHWMEVELHPSGVITGQLGEGIWPWGLDNGNGAFEERGMAGFARLTAELEADGWEELK